MTDDGQSNGQWPEWPNKGQIVQIFWIFRIFSDTLESWKRCMSHQMYLFVHRFVPRILETTKTYLQGAYSQYALHICPFKDTPDMGHTVNMPTVHLWKTYHKSGLSVNYMKIVDFHFHFWIENQAHKNQFNHNLHKHLSLPVFPNSDWQLLFLVDQ